MSLHDPLIEPFPWEYDAGTGDDGLLCDLCGLPINAAAPGTVWTVKGDPVKAEHGRCRDE